MPQDANTAIAPFGSARDDASCRSCGAPLGASFLDLGPMPLDGGQARTTPLHLRSCSDCRLVQAPPPRGPRGTARFRPGRTAREAEALATWLQLDATTPVVEIGSGEAQTLLPFLERHVPVLGIEPDAGLAACANARGIPTIAASFNPALALRLRAMGHEPVLISAPGALAEAEDLQELLAGLRALLAPGGVLLLDLPYLLPAMEEMRLDIFRHGLLSHHTLATAEIALAQHGLVVFDVDELPTPPGALRILARHVEDRGKPVTEAVEALRRREVAAGAASGELQAGFAPRVATARRCLRDFLMAARRHGHRAVGSGAPGCGETLLAYCDIGADLLSFVAEADTRRHGRMLPGTSIPIRPREEILSERPDIILILVPDQAAETIFELGAIRGWGGRFALLGHDVKLF